jgi:hypothetical protein
MISPESQQRLIRYASAVLEVERTSRKIYFRDGGCLDMGCSLPTHAEYRQAKMELAHCPEPEIRALVHQMQIERVDEAMEKSELEARNADDLAMLAKNELVALGWKFKQEQAVETKIQPCRRRKNGRVRRTDRSR